MIRIVKQANRAGRGDRARWMVNGCWLVVLVVCGAAQPQPLKAQAPPPLADELDEIKSRLAAIEELQAKAEPERPKIDDRLNEAWSLKLGGQILFDHIQWADASPAIHPNAKNVVNWRRIRLHVDGNGYGVYDMRVQLDFESDNDLANGVDGPYVAMKDVYLGLNELPLNGRLRFGNFFVPFSLEQLTPLPTTTFMERPVTTTGVFSPAREVGVASYHISDDLNKTLALGLFFDDIPESTKEVVDDNQGLRLSARSTWLPYFDEASNGRYLIHTGAGFIHTDSRDQLIRFRARPGEYRETQRLIDSGVIAANSYSVANLELATVSGPLSLQSELYATAVDRIAANDVMLFGAYLQGSYFLTGENRRYDRDGRHAAHFGSVTPHTSFRLLPGLVGWGAWEAKARWAYLDFNELQRGQYNELTMGMNWYWTENARLMFEWTHPWTSADATIGNVLIGAVEADLLAMRMQFTF